MSGLLQGLSAMVTGGGSGIGRATALAFAQEGARVAICDIDVPTAHETVAMIEKEGGEAFCVQLDVSEKSAVDAFVDQVAERWGAIDVAFNNAGISVEGFDVLWGATEEALSTFDINCHGVLYGMAAQLRHMEKAGRGSIVNTASIAGLSGNGGAGYCGSKHAVVGFTRSAAIAYAAKGIRVNCVCPGVIETNMTQAMIDDPQALAYLQSMQPMPRLGKAHEVADAVVFLASSKSTYITGHALVVDGGCLAR